MSGEILIYETPNGECKVDAYIFDDNIWITQSGLVNLFQTSKANISMHIKNIFEENELQRNATVQSHLTVQKSFFCYGSK
jgi:hypothetical protein